MEKIRITLETLYDILRNEKKREDLQKLENTFFLDVVSYLREKQALLEQKKDSTQLFASGERDKLEYELRSIKRILKEIYEKREKKVLDIALNRSRTGSDIIDTSALLREEKEFYDHLLRILDTYRKGILECLFKGELPAFIPVKEERTEPLESLPKKPGQPTSFSKFEGAPAMAADEEEEESSGEKPLEKTPPSNTTKIKFLRPVPSFVWKDLKVYGPYEAGEETRIFPEVADLLVRKGRAEKV